MMTSMRFTLVAMVLLAVLGVSASASAQGDQIVTKTFQLTLYGDVPEGETFEFSVSPGGDVAMGGTFCGTTPKGTVERTCVGNGTVYNQTVQLRRGDTVSFAFTRVTGRNRTGQGGRVERFENGTETINSDMTNSAWYRFGGGTDDQQVPSKMPSTGTGRAAGGLPLGSGAAAVSLFALTSYALRRWAGSVSARD